MMYRYFLTCLIVISLFSPVLGSDFEGIIHSKGLYLGKPIKGKTYIKGLKLRMDISKLETKSPTVLLFDIVSQVRFVLYPSEMMVKGPFRPDASDVAFGRKRELPPFFKTGKTEIIAGLPTTQFIQKYEDGRIDESWETNQLEVSRDLKLGLIPFFGKLAFKDSSSLADKNGWDLRNIRRWPDGSIWQMTEVIKIEHVSLSDDLFMVPPDYKKVEKHHHDHKEGRSEDIKNYGY